MRACRAGGTNGIVKERFIRARKQIAQVSSKGDSIWTYIIGPRQLPSQLVVDYSYNNDARDDWKSWVQAAHENDAEI